MRLDTSVTDVEFEDAMMARRRRPRPARHTCANCAHDGCCADLHHCGGSCWAPAEDEREDCDPYDGPDPYDQWLHDSEVWQEQADRRW